MTDNEYRTALEAELIISTLMYTEVKFPLDFSETNMLNIFPGIYWVHKYHGGSYVLLQLGQSHYKSFTSDRVMEDRAHAIHTLVDLLLPGVPKMALGTLRRWNQS